MKGVAEIISVILLLMITIGITGTAYVYIAGMMTQKTAKVISILQASCNSTHILLVITNEGTDKISSSDVRILVNNKDMGNWYEDIDPRGVSIRTDLPGNTGQQNSILIISPSNSITQKIWC
jgi:flagellin-like protein